MKKRLYRSRQRVIGGVCAGVAEYFDIDPTWIRLLFVLLIFASGIGLVAYIVGWIVIPARSVWDTVQGEGTAPGPAHAAPSGGMGHEVRMATRTHGPGFLPGVILVALGMIFLFNRLFFWFDWEYIWPLVLIGIGGALVLRAVVPRTEGHMSSSVSSEAPEVSDAGR